MTGKAGRSGGKRVGAGRKPADPVLSDISIPIGASDGPIALLVGVMGDLSLDVKLRMDAAKALLPYTCKKVGEDGKKEERASAAKKVASGRFAPGAPPKLVVNNR